MTTKLSPETDGDPLLAYRDQEFLDSDDARPLRNVAEYLAPMRADPKKTIVSRTSCSRKARSGARYSARMRSGRASSLSRKSRSR